MQNVNERFWLEYFYGHILSHTLRPPLPHVKTNSMTRILGKVCTKSVYV